MVLVESIQKHFFQIVLIIGKHFSSLHITTNNIAFSINDSLQINFGHHLEPKTTNEIVNF